MFFNTNLTDKNKMKTKARVLIILKKYCLKSHFSCDFPTCFKVFVKLTSYTFHELYLHMVLLLVFMCVIFFKD